MNLKTVTIADLEPHPENPNTHPAKQIDALGDSLDEFDQVKNVVIWRGLMLAGHAVREAAIKSGRLTLDAVDVSHWDEAKAKAFMLADIRLPDMGIYDEEAMAEALRDIDEPLDIPGFDEDFLARIGLEAEEPKEPEPPQIDKAEELRQEWGTSEGDVWQLGRHRIACIDSLDESAVKVLISEDAVRMVWADPPYGINIVAANVSVGGGEAYNIPFGGRKITPKGLGSSNGPKPFGSKKVRGSDGAANLIDVGKYYPVEGDDTTETACKSVSVLLDLFPDARHFWWGGNYYTNVLFPSPCWIIWDKDNTGNFADCEMAWTNQSTASRIFEHRWNGMLKASEHGQRRVHPTQKPVALAHWCFEKYGNPDDVIFDPFLGSGISVLAAEQMDDGRRVIGCELVPEYIAVVIQRWVDLTDGDPVCVSSSR
ncbi:MAG: DNA methyltransferase [Planctomycetota bacterium]|jgi:hypothetical protein